MEKITGFEMAEQLSNFVNNYNCDEKGFIEQVMNKHRTLQQSIGRLMIGLINAWSEQYNRGRYDARNERICKISNEIVNKFKDELWLPMI
jgi:hypothetical protein